jgi:hypothetical protein
MFGAVDVHYPESGGARAALVVARDSTFTALTEEHVAWLPTVEPYRPGHFYLRELPAIQEVLGHTGPLDLLVVDGYVDLDPAGRPGLGTHVHRQTGLVVVGVAKTAFRTRRPGGHARGGDGGYRPDPRRAAPGRSACPAKCVEGSQSLSESEGPPIPGGASRWNYFATCGPRRRAVRRPWPY